MRPALARRSPSCTLLFDFLESRLCNAQKVRWRPSNTRVSFPQVVSARHSTTRANASRSSILDVASIPENDPSYHAERMHKCALDGDVFGVWAAYGFLRDKHPRLLLGPQHYGATSLMLVKLYAEIEPEAQRSEEEMHTMEELAFACAGAGYVEGFRQMMLWNLAKRDADKVLDAYERFERTVLVLDESGLERGAEHSDVATSELEPLYEIDSSQPRLENPDISRLDVANIMAITIAAYALKNRFHDALQFMLRQEQHRITGDNLKELGRDLGAIGDSNGALQAITNKTNDYVEAGGMARLVQKPEVFKAHLRNLLKERNALTRLAKLTRILKDGFTSELAWAAADESQQSPSRPIVVPEKIWAYVIHAYVGLHHEAEAEHLWADVIRFGRSPGVAMWNALLEGYRDTQQKEKLLYTWDTMKEEGIAYDARSYGAKLGCLCQERIPGQQPLKLFEEFKKTKANHEDSLFVFNTVLDGLLSSNDVKTANILLEEMKRHGPHPDIVSYNTFVAYYAKKANMKAIAKLVHQLTESGVEPDVFTFTTILTAMLKARIPDGAERLLAIMDDMGVKQNVATYSALVDSQVREGTRQGITAAWQLLQRMERMKDVKPNIVTYTSFLAGVHRSREIGKDLITSISSDIVQTMKRRGMRLKLGTFHILFKACLENPKPEALEFFIDYYNMMRRNGIECRHDTWYVILDGLARRGAWKLASEMKNQMIETGFQPMWGVMERVKAIQRWERHERRARIEQL